MSEFTIDVAAVQGTANGLRSSSDVLIECARSIDTCSFGLRDSGRNYADQGAALQAGYGRLSRAITAMSTSTAACANGLSTSTGSYVDTDRAGASSLRGPLR